MAKAAQAVKEKPNQQKDPSSQDTKKQAQSVELSEAVETEPAGAGGSIDILLDMNVSITVTIGRTEMPVQRLLRLGPGSVLKLDKSIDEPADLYLRDTMFATGNVVVVDGRFAIRIKQILGLGDSAAKAAGA
ncbi:MAG TPA: FliM/FliN family flagellar motor switch protein [Sedimentisphaerales bacterium]|nr:FliM/FliN family flagellar motor switch protein [Sedimentisphaerales bacterium]